MIDFELFFSTFYVARKPIISGGAIRLFAILAVNPHPGPP